MPGIIKTLKLFSKSPLKIMQLNWLEHDPELGSESSTREFRPAAEIEQFLPS